MFSGFIFHHVCLIFLQYALSSPKAGQGRRVVARIIA